MPGREAQQHGFGEEEAHFSELDGVTGGARSLDDNYDLLADMGVLPARDAYGYFATSSGQGTDPIEHLGCRNTVFDETLKPITDFAVRRCLGDISD